MWPYWAGIHDRCRKATSIDDDFTLPSTHSGSSSIETGNANRWAPLQYDPILITAKRRRNNIRAFQRTVIPRLELRPFNVDVTVDIIDQWLRK